MKKLFICVMTSLCSTFAFADADFVVKPATISGGNGTMEVVINKANTTAFQFDVALPAGVSATGFSLAGAPATRKFEQALYNADTNTYRFLTYDEGNAGLDAATTFNIALSATDGAKTGEAESLNILLVDPDGNGTDVAGSNSNVTIQNTVSIPIGSSGKTTFVCAQDLDFSSVSNVKAYIAMGYDLAANEIWLASVTEVPANTPIWVMGTPGDHPIPTGASTTYYPTTLLVGDAANSVNIPAEGADNKYYTLMSDGSLVPQKNGVNGFPKGKAYISVPKNVMSNVGTTYSLTIGDYGNTTLVYNSDLDFTSAANLYAYVVIGYSKVRGVVVARVKKVSAGTPLYLKGNKGDYPIPSTEQKMYYVNMLEGDATSSTPLAAPTEAITNYVLREGLWGPLKSSATFPGGKAYLPIPTSYTNVVLSRGMNQNNFLSESEAEVIVIKLGSANGENDGTTGIRSIDEGQFTNDTWYNLNGQRIDAPTKKGLYIKNGKKVLVK